MQPTAFLFLLLGTLATLATLASAAPNATCQCDAGDFWCTADNTPRLTYNCSGFADATAAWKVWQTPNTARPPVAETLRARRGRTAGHRQHGARLA